jgi:hypothetical protein
MPRNQHLLLTAQLLHCCWVVVQVGQDVGESHAAFHIFKLSSGTFEVIISHCAPGATL